jgi:hypothetical protein
MNDYKVRATMRKVLSLFLFAGMVRAADAHTLAADDGLPAQLMHQILAVHHLPTTVLLLLGVIAVLGIWHKTAGATVRYRK